MASYFSGTNYDELLNQTDTSKRSIPLPCLIGKIFYTQSFLECKKRELRYNDNYVHFDRWSRVLVRWLQWELSVEKNFVVLCFSAFGWCIWCTAIYWVYRCFRLHGDNLVNLPQRERRTALEKFYASHHEQSAVNAMPRLLLSQSVKAPDWDALKLLREESRGRGVEGFMLKHLESKYGVGRTKADGLWWKLLSGWYCCCVRPSRKEVSCTGLNGIWFECLASMAATLGRIRHPEYRQTGKSFSRALFLPWPLR